MPAASGSSTPSQPSTSSGRTDRPKAPTACNNCRQRKLRCDGNRPACSNCQLHEAACVYVQGRNKSGPPKGSKRKKPATPNDPPPSANRRRSDSPATQKLEPSAPPPIQSTQSLSAVSSSSSSDAFMAWPELNPDLQPLNTDWAHISNTLPKLPHFDDVSSLLPEQHGPSQGLGVDNFVLDPELLSHFPSYEPTTPYPANSYYTPQSMSNPSYTTNGSSTDSPPTMSNLSFDTGSHSPSSVAPCIADDVILQYNPAYINTVRSAHPFAPLLPLPDLLRLLSDCRIRKDSSVQAAFCLSAFCSLIAITSPEQSASTAAEGKVNYATAQKHSMAAYFTTLSGTVEHKDDAICTAAGLVYLTLREVFAFGWGKEASTWLWLAADIVQTMPRKTPMEMGIQRWFLRVVWLWEKALTLSGAAASAGRSVTRLSATEIHSVRDESPLAMLDLDDDQRTFNGLVSLCLDLENMIIAMSPEMQLPGANPQTVTMSLSTRVNQWVKATPIVRESLLLVSGERESSPQGDTTGEIIGQVLMLIYFAASLRIERYDRARCTVKKTSMHVAVSHIVNAADWFSTPQRSWLWSFAEPALLLAADFLIERSTSSWSGAVSIYPATTQAPTPPASTSSILSGAPPTPPPTSHASPAISGLSVSAGDSTLLGLIKDVFADAMSVLENGQAHKTIAAAAIDHITTFLDRAHSEADAKNALLSLLEGRTSC